MRQNTTTAAGAAETRLLAAADMDQDGWISYGEWLLLLALLAIPEHELKAVFNVVDLDGNGEIDFKEFDLVMQVRWVWGGVVRAGGKLQRVVRWPWHDFRRHDAPGRKRSAPLSDAAGQRWSR